MSIQPSLIKPSILPTEPKAAVRVLWEIVNAQHEVLRDLVESLYRERAAEPDKPRNGQIAAADGTNWNPGSGRGLYRYMEGTWSKL